MVHQSPVAATVLLTPEVIKNEEDKGQIAERVKAMTGRSTVEVLAVRHRASSRDRRHGTIKEAKGWGRENLVRR